MLNDFHHFKANDGIAFALAGTLLCRQAVKLKGLRSDIVQAYRQASD